MVAAEEHPTFTLEAPEAEGPSRADLRREAKATERALERLARDLVQAPERILGRLELSEAVLDAVHDARAIRSAQALNRALRRVRQWLRDEDWGTLRTQLDGAVRPVTLPSSPSPTGPVRAWCSRLLDDGDSALDELVSVFPGADRRELRVLARNARHSPEQRRNRAERALAAAVARVIAERGAADDASVRPRRPDPLVGGSRPGHETPSR